MGGYRIDLRKAAVEVREHRTVSFGTVMLIAGIVFIFLSGSPLRSTADTATLYPTLCSGDWHAPSTVQGVPVSDELLSSFFDRTESSARPSGSDSRMFCSFQPELDETRTIERVILTFVFALGAFGQSDLTNTASSAVIDVVADESATSTTATSTDGSLEDVVAATSSDPAVSTTTAEPSEPATTSLPLIPEVSDEATPLYEPATTSPEALLRAIHPLSFLLPIALPIAHAQVETVSDATSSIATTTEAEELQETQEQEESQPEVVRTGVLRFSYTTNGETWHDLGGVDTLTQEISFDLPVLTPQELQTLVVRVIADGDLGVPVYLEGIRLSIEYAPEEQAEVQTGDMLIGVRAHESGMPHLDDFTMPRIIAFGGTIAAVLSNTQTQALFVFRYDDFEAARIVAYAQDMAANSPLSSKDGRLYWLGRANDVIAYEPGSDAYFSQPLLQSTTTPGALEARFQDVSHTFVIQDGRVSFRDSSGVLVASDDELGVRDTFLATYFRADDLNTVAVNIGSAGSGESIMSEEEAVSRTDATTELSPLAAVSVALESFFRRALVSKEAAQHSCRIEPFRVDVSGKESDTTLVQMILETDREYILETDTLPYGISIAFGPDSVPAFTMLPGWSEPVLLTITKTPDARIGDFTLPLFLTSVDSPQIATACKVNIVNL